MITIDGATKRYRTVTAVDGVSFTASPGRVTALLGPNGAGKTSLLRMIVGLTRPDAGSVSVRAGDRAAAQSDIGYLPEERGLFKGVSPARTLAYFGRLQGMAAADVDAAVAEWLARVELTDRADDKVETLSRGNQQKVQVAAALLHRPAVAVLDEPFSGLDPINQDLFLAVLDELRQRGATVLLSAHQMSLVERVADDVVLIAAGKLVARGALADVTAGESLHDVYVRALGHNPSLEDVA